ncbi:MAG: hypothetical protein ACRELB_09290 [Polyangiaceae bacterium]
MCTRGELPRFGGVAPSLAAVEELWWFFNEALIDVEQPSSYEGLLTGDSPVSAAAVERRAEAVHGAWTIHGWLQKLRVFHARMLEALFTERPWPERVEAALGILTGPVESLPLVRAEHLTAIARGQTTMKTVTSWLDERLAWGGERALAAWRREAEMRCATAVLAYELARGNRSSVSPASDPCDPR